MKHTLLFFLTCLLTFSLQAQAPKKFNYQGVARDSSGAPFKLKPIGLRLSILSGGVTGPVQYSETLSVVTNQYGLFTVSIGSGTPIPPYTMDSVNWASGDKYLKVEIDPLVGSNYTVLGTTQLLSVPYAMYAANVSPSTVPPVGALAAYGFASGAGNTTPNSTSTLFVSNPASVVITSSSQKVYVTANQALEVNRPTFASGAAKLYIGYSTSTSPASPTIPLSFTGIYTSLDGTVVTVSAVLTGLAPGTYNVGMATYVADIYGYKPGNGNVTALVFN